MQDAPAHDENLNLAGSRTRRVVKTAHTYVRTEGRSVREGVQRYG